MNASDPSSPTNGNASPRGKFSICIEASCGNENGCSSNINSLIIIYLSTGKGYVEELPLQRFRQGLDQVGNPNLPPDDDPLLVECGAEFNPLSGEYSDRRREDDWSNR